MLQETLEALALKNDGTYIDVTFGGGGHSKAILEHIPNGILVGFDQDQDAHSNTIEDPRFTLCKSNFRYLKNFTDYLEINEADGVLADLGVSSHQIDQADRGFSFRFQDADLDMRMNQEAQISARDIVNQYELDQLLFILKNYGEIQRPYKIGQAIIAARKNRPIKTNTDLIHAVDPFIQQRQRHKELAKIFQAIRIEVNQELEALKELLEQSTEILKQGGRLVVMSYHSLEDRLVKHYMQFGNFNGEPTKDHFGNLLKPLQAISRKPITVGDQEREDNPRSRSAKLRVAEKL